MQSSRVWEQVQANLVTMTACTFKGYTFVYVLSVLDVFSRFLILRPLTSKSSGEMADALSHVFAKHGSPERFQTDQGTEFEGSVAELMQKLKVHIIKARPYHPQSQGKDERSHCTWKDYYRHDLMSDSGTSWPENLPVYMNTYNTSPHSSLGYKTPFEVYYCKKPLSLTKPILSLDTHADSEIPDTVDKQQSSNALPSTSLGDDQIIRNEAKISSNAAATKMVEQHFSRNLPSEYAEGDVVLVRLRQRHSQIKGKTCSAKTVCYQGKVIKKGVHGLEYTIEYTKDGEIKTGHFGVSDLTSLTVAEEKRRPKLSAQNALVTRDNSKVQPIMKSAPSKPLSMSTPQNSLSNSKGKSVSADSDTIGSNPMFRVFGPSKRVFYDLRYSDLRDITSKTA